MLTAEEARVKLDGFNVVVVFINSTINKNMCDVRQNDIIVLRIEYLLLQHRCEIKSHLC